MFFKLFNLMFFVAFNICVALIGTLLYKKALENEIIYQSKIALNIEAIDIYRNNLEMKDKISLDLKTITKYDKLLHYWLNFVNSSVIFLHNLNNEFLSSLLPKT